MVKKIRTRSIIPQTDIQNDHTASNQPQLTSINKNHLRNKILNKLCKNNNYYTQKRRNYAAKLQNSDICEVIDETQLQCPICLQMMVRPTLLSCGHMFCYRCLQSNSAHTTTCCLCRNVQNQPFFIHSEITQNLINQIILPRSNDIIKYLCRTTDATEWIKRRQVKNVKVGTIVDFQDSFKVWRKAIVAKITIGRQGQSMLNLKSLFKGNYIYQTIELSSKRLAPSNFFTHSKYLQQFAPELPQYDLYQNELEGLEYRSIKSEDDLFNFNQNECQNCDQNEWQQNVEMVVSKMDSALVLFEWEMNGSEIFL